MARRHLTTIRHSIQALWAIIINSDFTGFITGNINQGPYKYICVPGLNCYSCPGARGACPIGALQGVIGSWKFQWSFYIAGVLLLIGTLAGRWVCGWLCPFGLIQELLHKIPCGKKINSFAGDWLLRKLKYGILLIFVILLPLLFVDIIGQGSPYFCKLVCPVGMLEGGIPLVLRNQPLQQTIGWLYAWKGLLLVLTIILSLLIYRPFCKYICPLGAIYSGFQKVSILQYTLNQSKCLRCGQCAVHCPMQVDPHKTPNHTECIRCGLCRQQCPTQAIELSFRFNKK